MGFFYPQVEIRPTRGSNPRFVVCRRSASTSWSSILWRSVPLTINIRAIWAILFSFSYPNPLQCGASKFQHSIFDTPHVIIQCILGESVFSSDHEKYWKQKRTITRFRLYKKSFSKLNTNTTYLEKMQCFSFAERIATSFCNHQSTKTKKPQKRG